MLARRLDRLIESVLPSQSVDVGRNRQTESTPYRRLSEPAYHGAFVARYDRLRPRPPEELFELLVSLAPSPRPGLVVDLGAGTGISTAAWAPHAEQVVGIEINPDMLAAAHRAQNVEYRLAAADRTGLPAGCADVITCAQSFHWMPHESTIAEIARLLRPGGVFAAYDYDWPPLIDWEVDAAFLQVIEASGIDPSRPEKASHLERLRASGRFRAVREVFLQATETVDADHIVHLPLAFGPVARTRDAGMTESALGLERLREMVGRLLDPTANVIRWSYRIRLALK